MLTESEKINWIRIARTEGLGAASLHLLMNVYHTASEIIEYIEHVLSEVRQKKIMYVCTKKIAENELIQTEAYGGKILTHLDSTFPKKLLKMRLFPVVITIHGDVTLFEQEIVAIVGSRNSSINLKNLAHNFAIGLSEKSIVVASGLAKGIDAAVNSVILKGFPTIAVVANGINIAYPIENEELQKKIANCGGLIVSKEPFSSHPRPFKFIQRNAIMVALSSGVVIGKASNNSGSLNTAAQAQKQNKPLFAMPGVPQNHEFTGSNNLLRNGAKFAEFPEDVIREIRKIPKDSNSKHSNGELFQKAETTLKSKQLNLREKNEIKKDVKTMLDSEPVHISEIIAHSRYPIKEIIVALVELELTDEIITTDDHYISLKCNDF